MKSQVKKHFNEIANRYDYFKEKNWYYYKNLKLLYKELIPKNYSTLEIGCGTGDILSEIISENLIGIDLSEEMIRIAKKKHPKIKFDSITVEKFKNTTDLEYIFLADVIEHLEDIPSTVNAISKISNRNTKVIFTFANPMWEPILMILEKLKLKMPEGPHYRIPFRKLRIILEENGLITFERGWRLLIPANIPFLANSANSFFYKVPVLKKFGMLEYIIVKKI